ncbi:MAG: MBL fold metallo-hydrolase [Chloroflexi bacterium]|nr:MBL fold metallo-hydrolase [Chloroflexota bacterium]
MGKIQVRYFAVSAFEIVTEKGMRVLIDPCLSGYKGHGVSPVPLNDIKDIDLFLLSHGAGDHLGDILPLAKRMDKAPIMCGGDVKRHLVKNGLDDARFRAAPYGAERTFGGIKVKVVYARHVSFFESGNEMLSGVPLGFILTTESGFPIYLAGDTSIYGDMKLYGELYKPQLAMLPVGGVSGPDFTPDMSPEEAAMICRWMGLKWAIPCHYVEGSKVPAAFVKAVKKDAAATTPVVIKPGEWKTFTV